MDGSCCFDNGVSQDSGPMGASLCTIELAAWPFVGRRSVKMNEGMNQLLLNEFKHR